MIDRHAFRTEPIHRAAHRSRIDVGHDQLCTGSVQPFGHAHADLAEALNRDRQSFEFVRLQAVADGCLQTFKHTQRRGRCGIAAALAGRIIPRGMGCAAGDHRNVLRGHAHIHGGDITPRQRVHRIGIGEQEVVRFLFCGIADDHRLAAAERETRHRVLVTHAAGEAQRIGQRVIGTGVRIHARAAAGGPKRGGMNGDNGAKAGFRVGEEGNLFMAIKIRGVEHIHVRKTPTMAHRQRIRVFLESRALPRPYTAAAAMGLPICACVSNGRTERVRGRQLFFTALQSRGGGRLIG